MTKGTPLWRAMRDANNLTRVNINAKGKALDEQKLQEVCGQIVR